MVDSVLFCWFLLSIHSLHAVHATQVLDQLVAKDLLREHLLHALLSFDFHLAQSVELLITCQLNFLFFHAQDLRYLV